MAGRIPPQLPVELLDQIKTSDVDKLPESREGKTKWTPDQRKKNRRAGPKRAARYSDVVREFIAWDGESVNSETTGKHNYVLFGSSNGYELLAPDEDTSLSTHDCFSLMIEAGYKYPAAIHFGYGFNYDVEMMTRDISEKGMRRLYETNRLRWGPYRIEYIHRKWFQLSAMVAGQRVTIKIWDVLGFFQASLLSSLRSYLPADTLGMDIVEKGKKDRNIFRYENIRSIRHYWYVENQLSVQLMNTLREHLHTADLPISWWHGPGAIASLLYRKNETQKHMSRSLPPEVAELSQHAYGGGRFEAWRIGRANQKVYVYDINSAYPAGMSSLPPLTGKWYRVKYPGEVSQFGVYRVQYQTEYPEIMGMLAPHPFMYRRRNGSICYPPYAFTVYVWSPEVYAARATGHYFEILDGWELEPTNERPFQWVEEMYNTRQRWKNERNNAEKALKLGLNSLYGKTAQRTGWEHSPDKIPKWHQLEWAGYITSYTRAKLWTALWESWEGNSLVAVHADSITSLIPLDLPISNRLGEWDYKCFDDLIILQTGVYYVLSNGEWHWKFRGFDDDSLPIEKTLEFCENTYPHNNDSMIMHGRTSRFVGGRAALHVNKPEIWRTWETSPRALNVEGDDEGKRYHDCKYCVACAEGLSLSEGMHRHSCGFPDYIDSHPSFPHLLPWNENREGDPP